MTNPNSLKSVELDVLQVVAATSVPEGAVRRMCERQLIPARNSGHGKKQKRWRVKVSDLDAVRQAYANYLKEADRKRGEATAARNRDRVEMSSLANEVAMLNKRVAHLESELGIKLAQPDENTFSNIVSHVEDMRTVEDS